MKKRIVAALLCMGVAVAGLAGCGNQEKESTQNENQDETGKSQESEGEQEEKSYPELNLNPTEAMSVNSEGIKAASPSEFTLTDD